MNLFKYSSESMVTNFYINALINVFWTFSKIKNRLSSSLEFKSIFRFVDEVLFDSRLLVLNISDNLSHTCIREISH